MSDPLARIIQPIVEGQIRSFLIDHPEVAAAWPGKLKPDIDKRTAIVNSLAKRISQDLLCPDTRVRLMAALVQLPCAAPIDGSVQIGSAQPAPGVESSLFPANRRDVSRD